MYVTGKQLLIEEQSLGWNAWLAKVEAALVYPESIMIWATHKLTSYKFYYRMRDDDKKIEAQLRK